MLFVLCMADASPVETEGEEKDSLSVTERIVREYAGEDGSGDTSYSGFSCTSSSNNDSNTITIIVAIVGVIVLLFFIRKRKKK